jgi:NitT/TauT family transport system ATP-binding protein
MSAITLENVSLAFAAKPQPFTVLEDISLSLHKGEFVVLLGPSGCGKSTILNLVAGFNKPDRGRVVAGETGPPAGAGSRNDLPAA